MPGQTLRLLKQADMRLFACVILHILPEKVLECGGFPLPRVAFAIIAFPDRTVCHETCGADCKSRTRRDLVFWLFPRACALGWYISGRWPSFKDDRFADFDSFFVTFRKGSEESARRSVDTSRKLFLAKTITVSLYKPSGDRASNPWASSKA